MNHICFERSSSWRSAKAAKNPPSTSIPPLFLRELRDEVRENVRQVEDTLSRKRTICALSRPAVIQNLRVIKCHADPHSSRKLGVDLLRLY